MQAREPLPVEPGVGRTIGAEEGGRMTMVQGAYRNGSLSTMHSLVRAPLARAATAANDERAAAGSAPRRRETDAPMLLKDFEVLQTRDVETARRALIETFGAASFAPTDDAIDFEATASLATLGDVAISFCHFAPPVRLTFAAVSAVRQLICLGGSAAFTVGERCGVIDAHSWSAVIPSGTALELACSADCRLLMIQIDNGRLECAVAALWGAPRGPALGLGQADASTPAMRSLRRAVEFAIVELEITGKDSSPVALAELQDLIVTRFIHGHYPDLVDIAVRDAGLPSRPRMRLLEDYLRSRWNEPVTVERLAEIANVGTRSIFRYFRQVHGSTPLDFMKTLRLQEARRGLQNPTDATSVSSEALRCGFNNMGHFAKDYRRKFGELPSDTLAAARAKTSRLAAVG